MLDSYIELRGSGRQHALPREDAVTAQAWTQRPSPRLPAPMLRLVPRRWEVRLWPTDVAMCSIYLSPLLVVLGLSSLLLRKSAFRWWVAGIGLICLAASLGSALPVRGWLYDLLPPMQYFRHAAAFRCFFLLTLALLGAMAARDLQDSADAKNVRRLRSGDSHAGIGHRRLGEPGRGPRHGEAPFQRLWLGHALDLSRPGNLVWMRAMMLHAWWLARAAGSIRLPGRRSPW